MNIIKYFNSKWTKPQTQFFKLKTDDTLWVVAQPEEFYKHKNPLDIWLYQRIEQTKWGKWVYRNETLLVSEDKTRRTKHLFDLVNI